MSNWDRLARVALRRAKALSDDLAEIPQIKRGLVYCHTCGRTEHISAANFTTGWPKCCGQTMSLDSPEERAAFKREDAQREQRKAQP